MHSFLNKKMYIICHFSGILINQEKKIHMHTLKCYSFVIYIFSKWMDNGHLWFTQYFAIVEFCIRNNGACGCTNVKRICIRAGATIVRRGVSQRDSILRKISKRWTKSWLNDRQVVHHLRWWLLPPKSKEFTRSDSEHEPSSRTYGCQPEPNDFQHHAQHYIVHDYLSRPRNSRSLGTLQSSDAGANSQKHYTQ